MNNTQLAALCVRAKDELTGSDSDVEYLYEQTHEFHIIAIRGTEAGKFFSGRGWMDILRDLAMWPKDIGAIEGHAGFVHGWLSIMDEIAELIAAEPDKPIILTGHSLGGAIALVGAYSFLKADFNLAKVVTFGAPRCLVLDNISDVVLVKLQFLTTQYEHYEDPVPGFMHWTDYDHINSAIIGASRRCHWFWRDFGCHEMDNYKKWLAAIEG